MGGQYLRRNGQIKAIPEADNYDDVEEIYSEDNTLELIIMCCFLQSCITVQVA
jgi:hypothetical protein